MYKYFFRENMQANDFAQAYYHSDEPEFNKLAILFGDNKIKVEKEKTIVLLSDSTNEDYEAQRNKKTLSENDEEVTSPSPSKARKAFAHGDSRIDLDLESTTNANHPTRKIAGYGGMSRSKGKCTSSCASSSPNKFWKNLFK